ncbi:MAG: hypothetical protein P4L33_02195 [Capsulimonadaceae bacterium]|nr:hypothetical protein [Capsulimonadaceae bacterium]
MSTDPFRRVAGVAVAFLAVVPCAFAPSASAAPNSVSPAIQAPPADQFKLTKQQKDSLQAITSAAQKQMKAIQDNPSLSRHAKAEQIAKLVDNLEAQTKAIFDVRQRKLYEADRAKSSQGDELHLTTQQKVELSLIRQETERQTTAVFDDPKAGRAEKARRIEKILADSKRQQIAALSPAQVKLVEGNDARQQAQDPLHRTLDQRIQMRIIEREAMGKGEKIYFNKKLTEAQKKAQITALQKSAQTEQEAILTPQQRQTERTLMASQSRRAQ